MRSRKQNKTKKIHKGKEKGKGEREARSYEAGN